MGDAKRRRSICNDYRLEPFCTSVSIKTAGMPEEIKSFINNKPEEYWNLPTDVPSGYIRALIDLEKEEDKNIIFFVGDGTVTISVSEFIHKVLPPIQNLLTETTLPEIEKVLNDCNPQKEVLTIAIPPVNMCQQMINFVNKYGAFAIIIIYEYEYRNIYN